MKSGYHGWKRTAAKWPNKTHWRIDVYPFVAVNLALLIIFMIVPGVTPRHSSGPELPRSRYACAIPRAVREDAQIVSVARDGRIFYRNTVIAVDELPDRIRESIKNGTDRKVYVRADARATQDVAASNGFWTKSGRQVCKISVSLLRKSRCRIPLFMVSKWLD